ncbi:MAG: hypothetical protein ACI4R9_00255 [Kiritimatiellia bacterium]
MAFREEHLADFCRRLSDATSDLVFVKDAGGRFTACDAARAAYMGRRATAEDGRKAWGRPWSFSA